MRSSNAWLRSKKGPGKSYPEGNAPSRANCGQDKSGNCDAGLGHRRRRRHSARLARCEAKLPARRLFLLLFCVAKIVFHDAWWLSELDRYITFIALGAALTLVSTLYGKFRNQMNRLL